MAITTARDIITKAMKKVNILASSDVPTAEEIQDGLDTLNNMISLWSINNNMTVAQIRENTNTNANVASIQIGSGQTWNTARPNSIVDAYIRIGTTDYPVEVLPINNYFDISDKSTTGRPTKLFYDLGATQQANQTGTIYLYPKTDIDYDLHILSNKGLTEFSSINANITFPAYYKRALIYNLAIELSIEYGKQVSVLVTSIAEDSKNKIETLNAQNKQTIINTGLPGA